MLKLGGIGFGNGGYEICALDTRLQVVARAAPLKNAFPVLRHAENVARHEAIELPLKFDVVNGQHRFGVFIAVHTSVEAIQKHRNQGRLPVVDVHYVRIKFGNLDDFQSRLAEKGKPFAVVEVAVKAAAVEIVFVVDEIIRHSVFGSLEHACVLPAPAEVNESASDKVHFFAVFFTDTLIKRHNDPDVVAHCFQSLRQSPRDVSQTSRPQKRSGFRGNEQNFHSISLFCLKNIVCEKQIRGYTVLPLTMTIG